MDSERWRYAWTGLAGLVIVALVAVIATGCFGAAGGRDGKRADKGKYADTLEGVPRKTETAELIAPPGVPSPITRKSPALVKVDIEVKETEVKLDDGTKTTLWTFGGSVPGPMIRVREGDMVDLTLRNASDSKMPHSIDLHAVTGPGGGAKATQLIPGKKATFRFRALNPGVYVYHCATPVIPEHVARGMYGLIVVEPKDGLPKVDKEFYVMQGDMYFADPKRGAREFDLDKLKAEHPDAVVFNGKAGALMEDNALKAEVGDKVRIFFGVGGPNITSSFHVIGEIFDTVYPEGASERLHDIQTTLVPAGGATIVDFKLEVPGTYILVDHSLGRLLKGAAGQLVVAGEEDHDVFEPREGATGGEGGGH